MPFFPGERLASGLERRDPDFVNNALPGVEEQTGINPLFAVFTVVHTEANGGWDFILVRPRVRLAPGPQAPQGIALGDANMWWVYDADVDESECWIPQATFNAEGFVVFPEGSRFAPMLNRSIDVDAVLADRDADAANLRAVLRPDGEDTDDSIFPSYDAGDDPGGAFPPAPRVTRGAPDPEPTARTGPVTTSLDLEDEEIAKREGLPNWEEHEHFAVLVNANGLAVVYEDPTGAAVGIVRYPDKTAATIRESNIRAVREQAEKFLANRPYRTAMQRVLEEPSFDVPEPAAVEPETPAAPPRPPPQKRVWTTTPITSGDEDD
jgi:hypothetical protein